MDYILIIILQLIGIWFHVGQKLLALDSLSPDDSLKQVWMLFWNSDRITVFISSGILVLDVVGHFIVENYAVSLTKIEYYSLYSFALALILGYGGQRLLYKYLGKAEEFLANKVDSKLK